MTLIPKISFAAITHGSSSGCGFARLKALLLLTGSIIILSARLSIFGSFTEGLLCIAPTSGARIKSPDVFLHDMTYFIRKKMDVIQFSDLCFGFNPAFADR